MYRKFKADNIFNGTVFTGGNKVLITTDDGMVEAIVDAEEAGDVEKHDGIISPGFINAHCHLELSHMKGTIPEKTGLVDFVYSVVNNRDGSGEAFYTDEEIMSAVDKAENEMLENGIVAVGDICNNLITLTQKQKQRAAYYNFIEASGWLPSVSQSRFKRAVELYEQFVKLENVAGNSIVPHASYSVSPALWHLLIPGFAGKAISIHNQETAFEDEFFHKGTGDFVRMYELMEIDNSFHIPGNQSSLQSYFTRLHGASSVILVHNTFTKQVDIDFVNTYRNPEQQVSFCICINANQYIENALPPVDMIMKNNGNIVLGTDSLASNHSLNLLDEMRTIQKYFPDTRLQNMLEWATLNGAKALLMEDELGSFEKGKLPGVILINNIEEERISSVSTVKRLI